LTFRIICGGILNEERRTMTRWALIAAEGGGDYGRCALQVSQELSAAGIRTAGFVQRKMVDAEGRKSYELVRLHRDEQVLLAVDGVVPRGPSQEAFCSMAFHNHGFELARAWLEEDGRDADLLILGGVSKLETAGKGHCPTVEAALGSDKLVLVCARASQLVYVVDKFGLEEETMVAALELPADDDAKQAFIETLRVHCAAARRALAAS
jgi:nucleoside-triphosphatase THEP1